MRDAAANLEFEEAARLRDEIRRLEVKELGLDAPLACLSLHETAHQKSSAEIDAPVQPPSGRKPRKSRRNQDRSHARNQDRNHTRN